MIDTTDVEGRLVGWGVGGQGEGGRLTLTFETVVRLTSTAPLDCHILENCPELRAALELGNEDEARESEQTVSVARIGGGKHFTLSAFGCSATQRTGGGATLAAEKAKLLHFEDCILTGKLRFVIKGPEASLKLKISTPTEQLVDENETELGIRTVARLNKTSLWLDTVAQDAPADQLTSAHPRIRKQTDLVKDAGEMATDPPLDAARSDLVGAIAGAPAATGDALDDTRGLSVVLTAAGEEHMAAGAILAKATGITQTAARALLAEVSDKGQEYIILSDVSVEEAEGLIHRLGKVGCSAESRFTDSHDTNPDDENQEPTPLLSEEKLRLLSAPERVTYLGMLTDDQLRTLQLDITGKPTRSRKPVKLIGLILEAIDSPTQKRPSIH